MKYKPRQALWLLHKLRFSSTYEEVGNDEELYSYMPGLWGLHETRVNIGLERS